MEKLDVILWVCTGGFTIMFALLLLVWSGLNGRIDRLENRMDKLDEKMTDIDRRLCRMEGAFSSKDCCILKEERHIKRTDDL